MKHINFVCRQARAEAQTPQRGARENLPVPSSRKSRATVVGTTQSETLREIADRHSRAYNTLRNQWARSAGHF